VFLVQVVDDFVKVLDASASTPEVGSSKMSSSGSLSSACAIQHALELAAG